MKRTLVLSFLFLLWMGLLFGLPYLIYSECKNVYDFHTCESYAEGRIVGVEKNRKTQTLEVCFTDSTGGERRFSQSVPDFSEHYCPGAIVPVRYKPTSAFIDEEQAAPRLGVGLAGGVIFWIPLFSAFVSILKESVRSFFRKNTG